MIIKTNKFHFTNIACFLVTLKYRVKFVNIPSRWCSRYHKIQVQVLF